MIAEELKKRGVPDGKILRYDFDSMQYEELKTAKLLYEEVKARIVPGKTYLFLDEIQEVDSWERAVNSFMTDFDIDIYVTGSNSRMLSSEISTHLTGRYIAFRIFPLSFSEYLRFREEYGAGRTDADLPGYAQDRSKAYSRDESTQDRYSAFARYLRMGGFPAIHLQAYTPDEAYPIIRDIYNSVIFTDIVKRNQIRKVDQLERIVKFVFDNVGRSFSAASISKYLKSENRSIDNETVYSYLGKLESAFILHRCSRYDIRGKEFLKTQEKFYLIDPAFRYSTLGFTSAGVAAMLENIVCLELLRRGYDVRVGKLGNAEIDFVASRRENKLYIQIAQRIEREETERREYGGLLGITDNYPKYVLRTDVFADGNYRGIETMHIADFLLSAKY
jgi:predicted AAA+ superfamily ATPase